MVTMRPQRADTMSGIADWTQWNVPVRLTSRTRFHDSSDTSRNGSNQVIPALVTRISMGPSSLRTASIAASTDVRSTTSHRNPMVVPPVSAATAATPSPSMSSTPTRSPRAREVLADRATHPRGTARDDGHPLSHGARARS